MCSGDAAWLARHSRLLADSYRLVTGKALIECSNEGKISEHLFKAPFALLSHGTEEDPVLNYGNRTALALWEMNWRTFTSTPSRLTTEPMNWEQRASFMDAVREREYADHYEGIRISSSGSRFRIENATVWNVREEDGTYVGQAALIPAWSKLED